MFTCADMGRAKKGSKAGQVHPGGPLITIDVEERERFRAERARRGWTQKDLARRVGVTPATISNLETGDRHPQVRRKVYAMLRHVLFKEPIAGNGEPPPGNDEAFKAIVGGLEELGIREHELVLEFIATLKKVRHSGS